MSFMKDIFVDDKGATLPIALLVMMVVVTFSTAMLTMSNTESRIATNDYDANKAFYLADAGIAYAIDLIEKNPLIGTVQSPFVAKSLNLAGGELTVQSITNQTPSKWQVKTTGKFNKIKKELSATITLTDNELDELKEIQIGFPAGANIDLGKKGTVDDVVYYGVPNYIALYKDHTPTTSVAGEYDIETKLENADDNIVYKHQGNLQLGNIDIRYNNKKILYINGDLEINSNTHIAPQAEGEDFLMIIVTGKVSYKLSGNSNANIDCVLVADTISFDNNNAYLEGIVVANNIIISNSSVTTFFDYKASVVKGIDLSGFLNVKYRISNWTIVQ